MEKFKDSDINSMSIIVEYIKDHLIPYISHLHLLKKMYDALTNLFSVRNIGQVMSLKNELRDMKMNDEDNITLYFVRISQLRYQLQAIEEIISETELVNIVLNGLPKTWDAFTANINTQKEYPTFEEIWTCCAQEESGIKRNSKRNTMIKLLQQSSRISGIRSLAQGRNQIKKRICQRYNASTIENMVTARTIVLI